MDPATQDHSTDETKTQAPALPLWLLALCLMVSLMGIVDRDLWTPDEPRDAAMSLEMAETGDYIVPQLASQPFVEKPPLYFAVGAFFIRTFGNAVGPVGAVRLSTALWGLGTLLMTFLLARRLFGDGSGRRAGLAVLILATMAGFIENSHWIRVDAALIFFVPAALWAFAEAYMGGRPWFLPLAGLFTAGAFLAKGVIGCLFIGAGWLGLAVPMLLERWRRKESLVPRVVPHCFAAATLIIPAVGWMVAFRQQGGPELWHEWWYDNHFGRLSGKATVLGHMRPGAWWYYLRSIVFYCLPWTPALLLWAWTALRRTFRPEAPREVTPPTEQVTRTPGDPAGRSEESATGSAAGVGAAPVPNPGRATTFLLTWLGLSLVFLSASVTKRDMYLAPLLPGLAILSASVLAFTLPRWLLGFLRGWGLLCLLLMAGLAATPWIAPWVPAEKLDRMATFLGAFELRHAMAALCLVFGGVVAWPGIRLHATIRAAALTALLALGALAVAGKAMDLEKGMKRGYRQFMAQIATPDTVAGWNFDETTRACFHVYCGWTVPVLDDTNRIFRIIGGQDEVFNRVIVTRERSLPDLLRGVPYQVLAEVSPGDRTQRRELYLVGPPEKEAPAGR